MRFFKIFAPILIAIFLIIYDYKFSYLDHIKQKISIVISPIYSLVNLPSYLYTWINDQSTSKQELIEKNKNLNSELTRLKASLQNYNELSLKTQKLGALLDSSYKIKENNFMLARVVAVSLSRLKKQILINKGYSSGIKVGQTVLGADGVIGQITSTTTNTANILMITDPTQYVPIKNQRNGIRGTSKGLAANKNSLIVNFIESDLDVKKGDIFLSSGIGSKFTEGYPVGKVTNVEKQANNPFLHIELEPIQRIEHIELVLVVTN
jgi:rod shape-determining protein MreC